MSACQCDFRQRAVGDGCEICNPGKSLEYAKQTIADLEAEVAALRQLSDDVAQYNDHYTEDAARSEALDVLGERARELRK